MLASDRPFQLIAKLRSAGAAWEMKPVDVVLIITRLTVIKNFGSGSLLVSAGYLKMLLTIWCRSGVYINMATLDGSETICTGHDIITVFSNESIHKGQQKDGLHVVGCLPGTLRFRCRCFV